MLGMKRAMQDHKGGKTQRRGPFIFDTPIFLTEEQTKKNS